MEQSSVDPAIQHFMYKEVLPPSGVTHCCQAYFTHPAGKKLPNVIVAKTNVIQIYQPRLCPNNPKSCHLNLLVEHNLSGNIVGMAVLKSKVPRVQRDSLLVTFRVSKLAALHWDVASHQVIVSSLHCWETHISFNAKQCTSEKAPDVLMDPQGRCAAVLINYNQVALLSNTGIDSLAATHVQSETLKPASLGKSYILNLFKFKIKEVRDLCFLHRYNEPVLLVLHEEHLTFAGNLTEHKDTMKITALTLNLSQQKHLELWSQKNLPFDCHRMVPVPLGGTLIFTSHLILYCTQGYTRSLVVNPKAYPGEAIPYMDLNPMRQAPSVTAMNHASRFSDTVDPSVVAEVVKRASNASHFNLDLLQSVGCWLIPSTYLLVTAAGGLFLLTLGVSNGSVQEIKISDTRMTHMTSCVSQIGKSWIFLGSWFDDSVLMHVAPESDDQPLLEGSKQVLAIEAKKEEDVFDNITRVEGHAIGNGVSGVNDKEEGGDVKMIDAKQLPSTVGKEGGSEVEIQSFVEGIEKGNNHKGRENEQLQSVKIDSEKGNSPQATEEDDEITDTLPSIGPIQCMTYAPALHLQSASMEATKFSVGSTYLAGTGCKSVWGVWAVRFQPEGLMWEADFEYHSFIFMTVDNYTKVLETGDEMAEITSSHLVDFHLDRPTIFASNILKYARILQVCMESVMLLSGTSKVSELMIFDLFPTYADSTGQMVHVEESLLLGIEILSASVADPYVLLQTSNGCAILLQADLDDGLKVVNAACPTLCGSPMNDSLTHITSCSLFKDYGQWMPSVVKTEATIFCVTCDVSRTLKILSIPDMVSVFTHFAISDGVNLLSNAETPPSRNQESILKSDIIKPIVVEVSMESFKSSKEMFEDTESGMFICGHRPMWMIANRGSLLSHPQISDLPVVSMCKFNNPNCIQGFVTACIDESTSSILISNLPEGFKLETIWPSKKVQLDATPKFLLYMSIQNTYALITTRLVPYKKRLPLEQGGEPQATYAYVASEVAAKERGMEDVDQLSIVRPGVWTAESTFDFMGQERVMCVKTLMIMNQSTNTANTYLVIGTAMTYGEDHPVTGRFLLFDYVTIDAYNDKQSDLGGGNMDRSPTKTTVDMNEKHKRNSGNIDMTKWRLHLIYQREFQGPVSSLHAVDGILIIAWGARIESHRWNGTRLETVSFHETSVLTTSITSIKQFVVCADIHKGLGFFQLNVKNNSLKLLAKDFDRCDVMATSLMVKGNKLILLAYDAQFNLRIFNYQPEHPESWKGSKLMQTCAFHCGHNCGGLLEWKLQLPQTKNAPRGAIGYSLDGSIFCLCPLWEDKMIQPLQSLQTNMTLQNQHFAGLNPSAYRQRFKDMPTVLMGGECAQKMLDHTPIVDGDLIWQYQYLSNDEQRAVSNPLGMSSEQTLSILDSLADAVLNL